MNDTQQIFAFFFAIFWGTEDTAHPEHKPFNYTFVFRSAQVRNRMLLSVLFFNVLPILFFGNTLFILASPDFRITEWTPAVVAGMTLHGVLPAFAVFGFHRLWIGIVMLDPTRFYRSDADTAAPAIPPALDPTIESLCFSSTGAWPTIFFGIVYVVVAFVSPHLFR